MSVHAEPSVLVTGFEAFDGESVNPSALAVQRLAGQTIAGHRVESLVLPVVFDDSAQELIRVVESLRPVLVICVGQAGGTDAISVERVAINIDDARMPDNVGTQPVDQPIAVSGPVAYWCTLPVKKIVEALIAAQIPAVVSNSAGTYVCNHVFYRLMETLSARRTGRGGFIHVPYSPEQVSEDTPSMSVDTMVAGLAIALEVALAS